jgi:cyclin T
MYKKNPVAARRISQKGILEKRKALILLGEALLLSTIRYDFNIQHPYEPLKVALKNLGISQKEVKQAAINLINDT